MSISTMLKGKIWQSHADSLLHLYYSTMTWLSYIVGNAARQEFFGTSRNLIHALSLQAWKKWWRLWGNRAGRGCETFSSQVIWAGHAGTQGSRDNSDAARVPMSAFDLTMGGNVRCSNYLGYVFMWIPNEALPEFVDKINNGPSSYKPNCLIKYIFLFREVYFHTTQRIHLI